ncbi:hypothetical protein MVEN_01723800 [Mycena venus]|uniref:Uncharacterized protein n=1 Tax=Mycena venus TaxID=2733690 RepID=A0A8H6XKK2_9AGAR|nr:hypothetical protein MVEN_01723800 [Mycena venus]
MWAVFVTVERPSAKALNRALLLIQDFEFSEYPIDSQWTLVTSKDLPSTVPAATTLPLLPDITTNNAFALMSLAEINLFVRTNEVALEDINISSGDWLVIDQIGLETSTCLVCRQVYDSAGKEDGKTGGLTSEFRACRVPYEKAWGMISNADVVDLEGFVDEDATPEPEDWIWSLSSELRPETEGMTEVETKREKALKELRDGGHAD